MSVREKLRDYRKELAEKLEKRERLDPLAEDRNFRNTLLTEIVINLRAIFLELERMNEKHDS